MNSIVRCLLRVVPSLVWFPGGHSSNGCQSSGCRDDAWHPVGSLHLDKLMSSLWNFILSCQTSFCFYFVHCSIISRRPASCRLCSRRPLTRALPWALDLSGILPPQTPKWICPVSTTLVHASNMIMLDKWLNCVSNTVMKRVVYRFIFAEFWMLHWTSCDCFVVWQTKICMLCK